MAFTISDVFNDNGVTSLRKNFKEDYEQLGTGQVIKDGLAAGTGYMLHTGRDAMSMSGRPSYMNELDWQQSQDKAGPLEKAFGLNQSFGKTIADYGRKLEANNTHNYSEGSPKRYIAGISGMGPTMVGMGLAAAGAVKSSNPRMLGQLAQNFVARGGYGITEKLTRTSSPLMGNVAAKITPYVTKYTPKVTELAGDVVPSAIVGLGSAIPEAMLEKQSAYDDVITEAKQNGTYVAGETEKKATYIGDQVFKMNVELLSGTNTLETVLTFSKLRGILPKNSFLRNAGKLSAVMASEGLQEGVQQIIPKIAANKSWSYKDPDVQEAAITGALGGGLFHGTGRLASAFMGKHESQGALGEIQAVNVPKKQEPPTPLAGIPDTQTPPSYKSGQDNIDSYINDAANIYKVDPNLIHAIAKTESNYQADAVSEAGAQGIMQLMPETAAGLGVNNSFDPKQNIDGGVKYLTQCLQANNGDIHQALAMYNGGQGNMNTAEAQAYANKVMDVYNKISQNGTEQKTAVPDKKYYNISSEVSNTNLTPLTEQKLNLLARDFNNEFGTQLSITSMKRDGDGGSWHDSGQAIDMVADILENNPKARQWLIDRGKQYGLVGLDEYANPSANATGGHIHFSDHGDKLEDTFNAASSLSHETLAPQEPTKEDLGRIAAKMDDVFNAGSISSEQRKAILEMAKEQVNILQEEKEINKLEDAIQIKDIETISKILPQETAEILSLKENTQTLDRQQDFSQEKALPYKTAEQGGYITGHQSVDNTTDKLSPGNYNYQKEKTSQANKDNTGNMQGAPLPQKNNSLKSTLQSNRELVTGKPSTDSNNIIPEQTNDEMRDYSKDLLREAKENGIKANYAKLADHIEHGVIRATTDLEERLTNHGIDIQPIKEKSKGRAKIDAKYIDKSEAGNAQKATLRGTMITVEGTSKVQKGDNKATYNVSINEIEQAKNKYGNPNYGIRELIQSKHDNSAEEWIKNSSNDKLRKKRRDIWENDTIHGKLGALNSRVIDSQVRAIEKVYEQYLEKNKNTAIIDTHKDMVETGREDISNHPSTTESQDAKAVQESRFGNEDEAMKDMLKAFGLEKPVNAKKTFNVIDDSDKALQKALDEFSKELNNLSANPMFNPKLITSAFKIGMIHLQRGLNNFADWSKAMLQTNASLKSFLPSVWDAVNAYPKDLKFDENKMTAVMRYIGTQYDKGMTDKGDLKKQLENMIGKEYASLIDAAYAGVVKYPTREELSNEHHDGANSVASRTGKRDNQDQVGANDGSGESGQRGQQRVQSTRTEVRPPSSGGVHGHSAARSGETGDSGIQAKESADRNSSAGSEQLSGSVRDSFDGSAGIDSGRTGSDIKSLKNRRNDAANPKRKINKTEFKAGDLESIKNDLPMLLPEQQEDVVFAERRLIENQGVGVLFTNGTGTGKTFSGLGIAKRFANQGKNNILIVTPNDKINKDWIETAKLHFDLQVKPLKNTKDAGAGISITTFANVGENNALVSRDWDLVIQDESQNLMSGEKGMPTKALDNLRALTFHERGLHERFHRLHAEEYAQLDDLHEQIKNFKNPAKEELTALKEKREQINGELNRKSKAAVEEWQTIKKDAKPKVVFLSATPFAYVTNIDYAEGYLFDYPAGDSTGYNAPNGKERFMIENFGYRMRYNKLTRPEGSVNSSVMEVQFHEKLRKDGALSGRMLTVDKDYDRGFILVDGGIGRKIDDGFSWLLDKDNGDFYDLYEFLQSKFKHHQRMYLLEAIKAHESIDLIKQYRQAGKKVVVFHDFKKGGATQPFSPSDIPKELQEKYNMFAAARPDLISLNFSNLKSPIQTLKEAFGDDLLLFNGDINKKDRAANVKAFNDDASGKDIILVQSDAGQAGISLHDQTGKHPRVLLNLGMPTKPVAAIQIEGRIYRTGQKTNAVFRYLNTGTMMERIAFATKIAERASTAENLALGNEARSLKEAFIEAFEDTLESGNWREKLPGGKGEGTGGKARDKTARSAVTEFDRAKTFYYGRGKKTRKNKSAEGIDYYATPEPLGMKMVEWADVRPGERILEPSAGHGAISRWFPMDAESVMIEPSRELAASAQMSGHGTMLNTNFEDYNIINKFDVITMNPPFGSGGKTAIEHLSKAFRHLKDGGRIVAIVPDGASCQKHFDRWMYGNERSEIKAERNGEKNAVLVKEILLPNVVFKNAGTQVGCKVLVIDKQETQAGRERTETEEALTLRDAKTIGEFFDQIEDISLPGRHKITETANEAAEKKDTAKATVEGNFEVDNYKHTKSGVIYPRAMFKGWTDKFNVIASLARRHDGYYSKYANGFLFKGSVETRDQFVKEANAFLSGGHDFSREGTQSIFDSLEFISDGELTKQEKSIQAAGEKLGVPVVFFEDEKSLHGFHAGGITFINRRANVPHSWVFWHESFHWMKNNNPQLYRDLLSYFKGINAFSQKQIDAYKKATGRLDLTNDGATEEMLADAMPGVARRVGLMKQLAKDNASLAERFVAWIRDMMDRFHAFFTTPAEGLSPVQKKTTVKAFMALARDMVDADGRNIFAVNRISGEITLQRNGKPVNSVLKTDAAVAMSGTGERFIDPIEERALELKKLGYTRGETLDILVDEYMPEDYDPSVSVLGFAQHELLTDKHVSKLIKDIQAYEKKGISYNTIEKQLFQRYNQYKGMFDDEYTLDEKISIMALVKGAMWHVRRNFKNDIYGVGESSDGGTRSGIWRESVGRFLEGSDGWRREQRRQGKSANGLNHSEKGGFFNGENETKYSLDNSEHTLIRSIDNLLKKTGLKTADGINIASGDVSDKVNVFRNIFNSMNKIAERYPKLKPFFRLGNIAREKQENLRNHFQHRLDKIETLLGRNAFGKKNSPDYKENKQDLFEILWRGDAETKEFTVAELQGMGYNEKVVHAYKLTRAAIRRAYDLVNSVKQQIVTYSKNVSKKEYEDLASNKFVHIVQRFENSDGSYFVTYKQPKVYERKEILSKSELNVLKDDENVQIISAKPESNTVFAMSESQGLLRGDDFYEVEYRTQIAPLGKIGGYIPHFFHNFFIMQKIVDENGNAGYKLLKSAKTLREATAIGNGLVKQDPDAEILISQKQFQFPDEKMQATIIGDKEYHKMMEKLSDDLSINLQDAQKFMRDKVTMKNRKRFFGNAMHRKGRDGFEQDMNWVLRHHFNQVARYVAMDEFKRNSINRFEQIFGKYDGTENQKGVAGFARDFINDMNGMPTGVENFLNDLIKATPGVNKVFGKFFPDRPSLQAAGMLTSIAAAAKLNCLNLASTIIQFTQLMNIGGVLNSYDYALKGMKAALKPTLGQKVILRQAGLEAEMGMNISGGYSKAEITNKFIGMSTWTFVQSDRILRSTAILGAYQQGINQGMTKAQAIEYAKDVNRKANFDYAVTDAPNLFRRTGPAGQVILQFQKYSIKQMELMWDMFAQGRKVDTSSIYSMGKSFLDILKNNDKGQMARFFLPYFLLSGMMGIPFVSLFGSFIGMLFGWDDWQEKIKKSAFELAGNDETAQAMVRLGIYGATAIPKEVGFDIGYRVGIGDFASMELPKSETEALFKLFGVTGSSLYQAMYQNGQGNTNEAIKAISPGLGNIAIALSSEVKTTRGRVKHSFGDDFYGRVLKAAGFMPINERIETDVNRIIKIEEAERRAREKEAIDNYITNPTTENLNRLRELRIKPKRVQDERKKKKMSSLERLSKREKENYRDLQQQ